MRNHAFEDRESGQCGISSTVDNRPKPSSMIIKQNSGVTTAVMFPQDLGAIGNDHKKSERDRFEIYGLHKFDTTK